jgi:hypothetical protein
VTLFTSDTKKINFITIIIFVCATIFLIIFNKVYSLFAHGVSSDAMTYAFIYPLIGVIVYTALFFIDFFDRVSYNLFNASIATIATGSLLLGVNEIAGADSNYYKLFYLTAFILCGISILYPIIKLVIKRSEK